MRKLVTSVVDLDRFAVGAIIVCSLCAVAVREGDPDVPVVLSGEQLGLFDLPVASA